jgi:hypothetical protein
MDEPHIDVMALTMDCEGKNVSDKKYRFSNALKHI